MQNQRSRSKVTRRAAVAGLATAALSRSQETSSMDLGNFSVSLLVKDLQASKKFYETLGFKTFTGDGQKWIILKNGDAVIGLFQGGLEKNTLTFNPGWDNNARKKSAFTDIRELQRRLKAAGIKFTLQADESTKGPASFIVVDPDGNPVIFDQHV